MKRFLLCLLLSCMFIHAGAQMSNGLRRGNYRNHRTSAQQAPRTVHHTPVHNRPAKHAVHSRKRRPVKHR